MSKPTNAELDVLRVGDRVILEGVVESGCGPAVNVNFGSDAVPDRLTVYKSSIQSVQPRQLCVGDKVTVGDGNKGPVGDVLGLFGSDVWVKFGTSPRPCTYSRGQLALCP